MQIPFLHEVSNLPIQCTKLKPMRYLGFVSLNSKALSK